MSRTGGGQGKRNTVAAAHAAVFAPIVSGGRGCSNSKEADDDAKRTFALELLDLDLLAFAALLRCLLVELEPLEPLRLLVVDLLSRRCGNRPNSVGPFLDLAS